MTSGSNLARAKISNQAAIRRIIYEYGPITRAEIADKLSLTLPTITTNINSMISYGLLEEVPLNSDNVQPVGRPANAIDFVSDFRYFIGVEVRRPLRNLCITDYRGNIIYCETNSTLINDYDECIENACELINRALASSFGGKVAGIGVCIPGIIDPESGILGAHRQNNWYNKNVKADVIRLTGFRGPVNIENNVLARAYGAKLFRKDILRDIHSFTYCYIFSGIACPLIINDSTMLSNPVGPGEIGYMILEPGQADSKSGKTGTLQNLAGEQALISNCADAMAEGDAPILKEICGSHTTPTMIQILEAQSSGDELVTDLVRTALFYLGVALANMDNLVRPDSMLIEGRLFDNPDNRDYFLDVFHDCQFRLSDSEANIIFVDYDDYSGARGGAAVSIRNDLEIYIP